VDILMGFCFTGSATTSGVAGSSFWYF